MHLLEYLPMISMSYRRHIIMRRFFCMKEEMTFLEYFSEWIELYKVGTVKEVTLQKYYLAAKWIKIIVPNLKLAELNRKQYQMMLNEYAKTHEKQTTLDFHHQLKSVIRDALEDHMIKLCVIYPVFNKKAMLYFL